MSEQLDIAEASARERRRQAEAEKLVERACRAIDAAFDRSERRLARKWRPAQAEKLPRDGRQPAEGVLEGWIRIGDEGSREYTHESAPNVAVRRVRSKRWSWRPKAERNAWRGQFPTRTEALDAGREAMEGAHV